ncbi:hypothetical protein Tco_0840851 [Tanacetum coccineum]|uniref:Uncharacterized protein n=1 Tax=Tanacetum coccineum TaxID=301880 RepID=A0ABQ5AZ43_9ASTR
MTRRFGKYKLIGLHVTFSGDAAVSSDRKSFSVADKHSIIKALKQFEELHDPDERELREIAGTTAKVLHSHMHREAGSRSKYHVMARLICTGILSYYVALTWWKTHVNIVCFPIGNARLRYPLEKELALLCGRMFPKESNKIKKCVGGLPDMIHGSAVRKQDNNQQQQQQPQNKRQNTSRAYAIGTGEKKLYRGSKPLCPKSPANANTANNQRGTGTGVSICGVHPGLERMVPSA